MSSPTALVGLLLVPGTIFLLGYFIYYPPKSLFEYLQQRNPNVLFQLPIPSAHRIVALTLDDCPSPHTATMLDSLRRHNAKATFFVIGDQVPGHEHIINRIHTEGHEVGNHAWTDEKSILRPLAELERQIKAVESLLPANRNGLKYFRPGGGFYSGGMVERVVGMGYRVVLGCVYPHDPQVWSPEINARHVFGRVRPGGIIIMHDRRGHSAPQLELVLNGLKERGWEVVSVGGLLEFAEQMKTSEVGGVSED